MGCGVSAAEKSVIIVGGGSKLAHELDSKVRVTLIEKSDGLTHHLATLRGVVAPGWENRVRVPLSGSVQRGVIRQGAVTKVESGKVTVDSGEQLCADFIILATGGPEYSFPMGGAGLDTTVYKAMMREGQKLIAKSKSILIVGGGPVGVELAGEIKTAHPDKPLSLVHHGDRLLSKSVIPIPEEVTESLKQQLEALGTTVFLQAEPKKLPSAPDRAVPTALRPCPGATHEFTTGERVAADLVIVATGTRGVKPSAVDIMPENTIDNRTGLIKVDEHLRVIDMKNVFATGDCVNTRETKKAYHAEMQAPTVIHNLLQLAYVQPDKRKLRKYVPGGFATHVTVGGAAPAGGTWFEHSFLGILTGDLKTRDLETDKVILERGLTSPQIGA